MLITAHAFHSERAIEAIVEGEADIVVTETQEERGEDGQEYTTCDVYTREQLLVTAIDCRLDAVSWPNSVRKVRGVTIYSVGTSGIPVTLREIFDILGLHLDDLIFLEKDEFGKEPYYLYMEEEEDE